MEKEYVPAPPVDVHEDTTVANVVPETAPSGFFDAHDTAAVDNVVGDQGARVPTVEEFEAIIEEEQDEDEEDWEEEEEDEDWDDEEDEDPEDNK